MSDPSNTIRDVARRASDAWNGAFNRGDAAALSRLYTDNASVLPPTHAVIAGTAAIRDFWQGLISAGFKGHGIEVIDAEGDDGLAFATGKWWASGPGDGGKVQRFDGTVVTVLQRQGDGAWKARLHIWN
jgi:ketosteroid isomerase-like protein